MTEQLDMFASPAPPRAPGQRRPRRKRKALPPSIRPWPCVVHSIDAGKTSGSAILLEGLDLVDASEVRTAAEREAVVERALAVARDTRLPLIVVAEKWPSGGKFARPAIMAGLGAAFGAWREVLEQHGYPERRIVRCYPQTWYSRVIGGRKTRDKSRTIEYVRIRFGRVVGPDVADAVGIGVWGAYAGEVGAVLPKAFLRARGFA